MSMNLDLARLDRWLRQRTPVTHESLRGPATVDAIDAAAAAFGVRLHPDLQRLWLWHDGCSGSLARGLALQPGQYFLSIPTALDEWRSRTQVSGDNDSRAWSTAWIPIASDGAGNHLVVDHHPSDGYGSVFTADLQNGPLRHRGWPSLTALITSLYDALEQGSALDSHHVRVSEGRLIWEFTPPAQ